MSKKKPLSYRMCPTKLDDFVGQDDVVGKGKSLYRMIKADKIQPIILFGPPGSGKTTLAKIISSTTKSHFEKLNAVTSGISDIRRVVEDTKNLFLNPNGQTTLFIDEIHRFNKTQQDALLPYVENGTIILIGATTENPYFEVNKALISRSFVYMLKPLLDENIKTIILRALSDTENGLGNFNIKIDDDAIDFIITNSNGDARTALNSLELATHTTDINESGIIHITLKVISECIQKKPISFDKKGDSHYDNISAFIKSMRGSDPDATVFYLARALYAGEDPVFLARRIIIAASEDVGLANPSALQVATTALNAVKAIGMPEARIILSQAAIYVATSPKSNASYVAINNALYDISNKNTGTIPNHLKNAVVNDLKKFDYGTNYKYVHDYPNNFIKEQYLPDEMLGTIYYNPTSNGNESKIKNWLDSWRK